MPNNLTLNVHVVINYHNISTYVKCYHNIYTKNIQISEHKFAKIASNWTSHRSFNCMGRLITTCIHKVKKYNVMYTYCEKNDVM